jgi:hypothetical protein
MSDVTTILAAIDRGERHAAAGLRTPAYNNLR